METSLATSGSSSSEELIDFLAEDRNLRAEYAADQMRTRLALMIRALREQTGREWTQAELGRRMGKLQSAVSRIEDPDYGKLSVQTLFEIAAAFDLPLWIDMPDWSDWIKNISKLDRPTLERTSFDAASIKIDMAHSQSIAPPSIQPIKNLFEPSSIQAFNTFGGQQIRRSYIRQDNEINSINVIDITRAVNTPRSSDGLEQISMQPFADRMQA